MQRKLVLLVVLLLVGYVALFYRAPLPTLEAKLGQRFCRLDLLITCLSPDFVSQRLAAVPPPVSLADRLGLLAVVGAILAWAAGLGWLLLEAFGWRRGLTRLETVVFSTAVGLNVLSTHVLLIGLMGGLHARWLVTVPAGLTLILAAGLAWRRAAARTAGKHGSREAVAYGSATITDASGSQGLSARWLWLAVPFVVVFLLAAMMPPLDFDVREYHLQAPKEFFQNGRIDFLPHNVYANMPLGAEMLSLLAMVGTDDWWLGALIGKTVLASMTLLASLGLLAAGRRFFSPGAGVAAALLYFTTPWIMLVSTSGLVEGAVACYWFLAIYGVLLWSRDASPRPSIGYLGLAGYMAGGAVACKYPAALFVVLPLTAWIAVAGSRRCRPLAWRPVGVFLLAVAIGCGLWLGKNWALTGNPTYPLLYEVFDGQTRTPAKNEQWNRVHRPHDFSAAALARDLCRVTLRSEWLSPLLFPLAALAFVRPGQRRLAAVMSAYFAYVIVAWWLLTHRIDRFWLPALPVVALLAGAGACWSGQRAWRAALGALLVFGLTANFLIATSGVMGDCRWLAPLAALRDEPPWLDAWHRYFNEHVRQGRVLLIGDAQPLDLEVPVLYNTCFDDSLFQQLAEGRTPQQVHQALLDSGIAYIYVDWAEIARYRSPGNYGFTDFIQPPIFTQLVEAGVFVELPPVGSHLGRGYRVLPK